MAKCWIYNELADIPDEFIVIEKPMIIVAFTSWKKRIDNVAKVVFNISNQSIKPDLIELNLCTEEFPNKEKDLPNEINLLVENNILHINWVDRNTYTFKKFIPTLQKHFSEDYYLITIDDDKLYDYDYIEFLVNKIKNVDVFCCNGLKDVFGGIMIYKSSIFDKDFWEKINNEIIETKVDDTYILYYLKHKKAVFGSSAYTKKWKTFNECNPTHDFYRKENRIKKAEIISKYIWNI